MGERACILSQLINRSSLEHLVDRLHSRANGKSNRVVVIDAFAIKDAIGEANPKTQRSKVVMREVMVALGVPLVECGYGALDAEVTHGHSITQWTWPRPAQPRIHKAGSIRRLGAPHDHALGVKLRDGICQPETEDAEGA